MISIAYNLIYVCVLISDFQKPDEAMDDVDDVPAEIVTIDDDADPPGDGKSEDGEPFDEIYIYEFLKIFLYMKIEP